MLESGLMNKINYQKSTLRPNSKVTADKIMENNEQTGPSGTEQTAN